MLFDDSGESLQETLHLLVVRDIFEPSVFNTTHLFIFYLYYILNLYKKCFLDLKLQVSYVRYIICLLSLIISSFVITSQIKLHFRLQLI